MPAFRPLPLSLPQSHAARAAAMTVEALRLSLVTHAVVTPAGRARPALRGEIRAIWSELARRVADEARVGGE